MRPSPGALSARHPLPVGERDPRRHSTKLSRTTSPVYVLVAIIKKRLNLNASLHTLLQILSVTLFEKLDLAEALTLDSQEQNDALCPNQLELFDF